VLKRIVRQLRRLGPGLITGASDDDPSGIATYSQAGARLGTSLLWTNLFMLPLMAGIQEISARLGRVTGRGIMANLRGRIPKPLLYAIVALLFTANTLNLGADLAAIGDAVRLLTGGPALLYAALAALLSAALESGLRYQSYARVLRWTTLVLFSYVAAAFLVHVDWKGAIHDTLVPSLRMDAGAATMLIAVLGTTISPYLFFWQSSEEAEEMKVRRHAGPLKTSPAPARRELRRIRLDTWTGMMLSNVVAFFIMLMAAVTLHRRGPTDLETAAQAAEALRPLAGPYAYALFTAGIVGTGLLAAPILAGSSAYAVSEALGWPAMLEKTPRQAKGFYAILALSFAMGAGLPALGISPVKALVASAVLNGIVAVPIMVVLIRLARSTTTMGEFRISRRLATLGWIATASMALASAAFFWTHWPTRASS